MKINRYREDRLNLKKIAFKDILYKFTTNVVVFIPNAVEGCLFIIPQIGEEVEADSYDEALESLAEVVHNKYTEHSQSFDNSCSWYDYEYSKEVMKLIKKTKIPNDYYDDEPFVNYQGHTSFAFESKKILERETV